MFQRFFKNTHFFDSRLRRVKKMKIFDFFIKIFQDHKKQNLLLTSGESKKNGHPNRWSTKGNSVGSRKSIGFIDAFSGIDGFAGVLQ